MKLLFALFGIILLVSAFSFGLNSLGLIGNTIVEREVFERSYQRSEGLKAEMATNQATLAEIESQLTNPNLDENTRFNLEAQARSLRIRINTARSKQQ